MDSGGATVEPRPPEPAAATNGGRAAPVTTSLDRQEGQRGPRHRVGASSPTSDRDDTSGDQESDRRPELRLKRLRPWWTVSLVAIGVEALLLMAWSAFQSHRFALGLDFSIYNQGAWLIAHGHLNPWSSIDGYLFARDHFTLMMWPIAAVYALYPHPITLLVLQDLASLGAGLVAMRWVLEILEYRLGTSGGALGRKVAAAIAGGALLAVLLDPWIWQGDAFDFHMEAFAALFIILASRDFWRHRPVRALLWCGLTLLSGDFGSLFVIGLAVSVMVAAVGFRRWGVIALALGAGWMLMVHRFGLANADGLSGFAAVVYGSTPTPGTVTIGNLGVALVAHPTRWLSIVGQKRGLLYENLIPTGFLGLLNPWTFGVTGVVLLSATLIGPRIFLQSGFQCLPAFAIGVVGTVLTLVAWLTHGDPRRHRRARRLVAALVGVVVLAQVVGLAVVMFPRTDTNWVRVSGSQAAVLSTVLAHTPPDAQVISSDGVMGRFSGRQWVEPLPWAGGPTYPLHQRPVVFVIVPRAGVESLPPAQAQQVLTYVRDTLHAHPIAIGHGVYGFRWAPAPGVHAVTLPTG
jgi:hypothetical protein